MMPVSLCTRRLNSRKAGTDWLVILLLYTASALAAHPALADSLSTQWPEYQLGRGYPLGGGGLRLGGYASAAVEAPQREPWQFQVRDLSLFIMWESLHWRFFSEIEAGDPVTMGGHGSGTVTTSDAYFDVERLYLDFSYDEPLRFRVGKFLTPIGRWNLLHADPLVWTTSRPGVTLGPFPLHATGAMLFGHAEVFGLHWRYGAYGAGPDQLDFPPPVVSVDRYYENTVGFQLVHELPGRFAMGVSYAHFRQTKGTPGQKDLFGLDLFWAYQRFEVSSEFVYRLGEGSAHADEWGLYLQGVAPLISHIYAVARYENLQPEGFSTPEHRWVVGLAYRPMPPLVFKAEYSFGLNDFPVIPGRFTEGTTEGLSGILTDGFAASVAVLF